MEPGGLESGGKDGVEPGPKRAGQDPPDGHPEGEADRKGFPPSEGTLDRALSMVAYLREHCAWDRGQTARSLVPHLLEEVHETVDAIHADDPFALLGELGDLLLNFAFQVIVAEESGHFTREDVISRLEEKMVRRHPQLFGGRAERWEVIKANERATASKRDDPGKPAPRILEGLARGMDPLLRAHRIQEKVAGVGFDWDEAAGALGKVREELAEVESAMENEDPRSLGEELGDLLFAVVNLARLSGTHALPALAVANAKFQRRFQELEALAHQRDVALPGASLAELDELWDEVKRREKGAGVSNPDPDRPGSGESFPP